MTGAPKPPAGSVHIAGDTYYLPGATNSGFVDGLVIDTGPEAEAYDGPSIIIAYSHCIQQGIDNEIGLQQQKLAVQSGYWPLFRYNPELAAQGKNPLQMDSRPPSIPLEKYVYNETRYTMLTHSSPEAAAQLLKEAQEDVHKRWKLYEHWAAMSANGAKSPEAGPEKPATDKAVRKGAGND